MYNISLSGYSWTRIFLQNIVKVSSRALKLIEDLGICIQYGYLLRIVQFHYMAEELAIHRESKLKAEIERKPLCLFMILTQTAILTILYIQASFKGEET